MDEIFDSHVRSSGDLAGVFEYDGETGYFYLYETLDADPKRVLEAIHIFTGRPDFGAEQVSVRWDQEEKKVGLFICGVLWAVFDGRTRGKYGGDYRPGVTPVLPAEAEFGFGESLQ